MTWRSWDTAQARTVLAWHGESLGMWHGMLHPAAPHGVAQHENNYASWNATRNTVKQHGHLSASWYATRNAVKQHGHLSASRHATRNAANSMDILAHHRMPLGMPSGMACH
eukprot:364515-Chlamydomonas_euryale.AAC.5